MSGTQADDAVVNDAPAGERAAPTSRLGDRLRSLRLAAGLTQAELAGDRFSKEYVSQIERGKTQPTPEAVACLAARLAVDASFLGSGVSTDERDRVEALLARGEALNEARLHDDAADLFASVRTDIRATGSVELEARALCGEARALTERGTPREALGLLTVAAGLVEGPQFSDVERANVLFRLGVCRYRLSSIATATALFDEALAHAERSGLPCGRLVVEILGWRARCRRRRHDPRTAQRDVMRALELVQQLADRRARADACLRASRTAEQAGHWVLAREYAGQAGALYRELGDERGVGEMLRDLGGLFDEMGLPERAIEHLQSSHALAVESESRLDAARAVAGLAGVHLRLDDHDAADRYAREALDLLDGCDDVLDEIGQCRLVLGRSLLERGRLDEARECFLAADTDFAQLSSESLRAGAWVALGDVADRRGDDQEAARLYRRAAEALRDIRF